MDREVFTNSGNDMQEAMISVCHFSSLFLFVHYAKIREVIVDQSVFLFFCLSFLLVWWLFSDQHYHFTWKTRPTSVHCFHHYSSFSVLWHSVYISPAQPSYNHNISMSAYRQVSSHKADYLRNNCNVMSSHIFLCFITDFSILPLSSIFIYEFEIVPKVSYSLFFLIFLLQIWQ